MSRRKLWNFCKCIITFRFTAGQITIPFWISNTSSNYLSRRSVLVGVVLLSKQKPWVFCPAKHIMFLFDCFHPFTFYLSDVLARRPRRELCVSLQIWTHILLKKSSKKKVQQLLTSLLTDIYCLYHSSRKLNIMGNWAWRLVIKKISSLSSQYEYQKEVKTRKKTGCGSVMKMLDLKLIGGSNVKKASDG